MRKQRKSQQLDFLAWHAACTRGPHDERRQSVTKRIRDIGFAATAALTLLLGTEAGAALILDETLTTTFGSGVTTVNPSANDLSNAPSTLHLGQLAATRSGIVDFFYIGHEAGYTNSLFLGGVQAHATN